MNGHSKPLNCWDNEHLLGRSLVWDEHKRGCVPDGLQRLICESKEMYDAWKDEHRTHGSCKHCNTSGTYTNGGGFVVSLYERDSELRTQYNDYWVCCDQCRVYMERWIAEDTEERRLAQVARLAEDPFFVDTHSAYDPNAGMLGNVRTALAQYQAARDEAESKSESTDAQ
jgi:hypothetical protein